MFTRHIEVKSRVIAAAMKTFGINSMEGNPAELLIPSDLQDKGKYEKLKFLHKASAKIVDEYILHKAAVNALVDSVITAQEQLDLLDEQQRNPDNRFLCRFVGCTKSFKHDGKRRRNHEATQPTAFHE